MPERIQRRRSKGWKMPVGATSVTRPGKWGNPFKVGQVIEARELTLEMALTHFEVYARRRFKASDLAELRGKNLACFCALDHDCHADVLLRMANE